MLEKIVSGSRTSVVLFAAAAILGYSVDSEAGRRKVDNVEVDKSVQVVKADEAVPLSPFVYTSLDPVCKGQLNEAIAFSSNPIYSSYHLAKKFEGNSFQTPSVQVVLQKDSLYLRTASGNVTVDVSTPPLDDDDFITLYGLDSDMSRITQEVVLSYGEECSRALVWHDVRKWTNSFFSKQTEFIQTVPATFDDYSLKCHEKTDSDGRSIRGVKYIHNNNSSESSNGIRRKKDDFSESERFVDVVFAEGNTNHPLFVRSVRSKQGNYHQEYIVEGKNVSEIANLDGMRSYMSSFTDYDSIASLCSWDDSGIWK